MKITKALGAQTNTYETDIKALSICPRTMKLQNINATVMFTSDSHGETLSIYDPVSKRQVAVAFEYVWPLIEHVRAQGQHKKGT